VVAAALGAALTLGTATAASASPGSDGPPGAAASEQALRIQAQELAGEIEADGRNLDRIAESLDAAQIRSQQLTARLRSLQAAVARTALQVGAARTELREQAVISYVAGGAALISNVPDRVGSDPSVTVSYAEIVAGGQRRAVAAYRAVLAMQTRQTMLVAQTSGQAARTVVELRNDRTAAAAALAARQAALGQVQGQLTVLVAQVEATQQQAAEAAVRTSLARQDQPPPPTPAVAPPPTPAAPPSSAPAPSHVDGARLVTARPVAAATPVTAPPARPKPTPAPPPPPAPPRTTAPPVHRAPAPTPAPPPRTSPRPRPTPAPTSPPTTAPPPRPAPPPVSSAPAPGSATALHYAYAQLGKPYLWGGAGPRSFDCSGLTMMAWAAAGVYLPHLAQAQYNLTARVSLGRVLPGDLIFYGTPSNVFHVGIYIGGGQMIDAPTTGETVHITSIYWGNLLGAGRVRG
jgi:cell wall-associated NlpC family hydrolase